MAKILLVDDDQSILTIFETALKGAGFDTVTALDGKSGLEKASTEHPDLVLLDQVLPDMNGNDVLKTLKADPALKAIPVSLLSNFGQNQLVQDALSQGAVDYILKYQVEPADLVNKVKEILKTSQPAPQAPAQPAQ